MMRKESVKALLLMVGFVICLLIAIAYSNWWINDEIAWFEGDEFISGTIDSFWFDQSPIECFRFIIPIFIVTGFCLSLLAVVNLTDTFRRDATFIFFLWPVFYLLFHHIDRYHRLLSLILSPFVPFDTSNVLAVIIYIPLMLIPVDVFIGALICLIALYVLVIRFVILSCTHNGNETKIKMLNRKMGIAISALVFNLLWAFTIIACNLKYVFSGD